MNTDFIVSAGARAALQGELPGMGELPTRMGTSKKPVVIFTKAEVGFTSALILAESAKSRARSVVVAVVEQNQSLTTSALIILAHHQVEACSLPDPAAVRRIMRSRTRTGADQLIASATVVGDRLLAWSCEPRSFECSFSDIPSLVTLPAHEHRNFEIDDDGSFIRWPAADIDIDLSAIRYAADPKFRKLADQEKRQAFKRYGRAIKRLREEKGLRQSDIPGLDVRQVRRLEKGEHVPHADTVARLAAAHGMNSEQYLAAIAAG